MKFGDNLRKIRKSKKMSQEQLAEKMNVTRQSVSKWENGESYPEMNNIFELCKVLNCKLNELVYPDMSDISSLDEEIVMNVVKFNEKKQKEVKTLSNSISFLEFCKLSNWKVVGQSNKDAIKINNSKLASIFPKLIFCGRLFTFLLIPVIFQKLLLFSTFAPNFSITSNTRLVSLESNGAIRVLTPSAKVAAIIPLIVWLNEPGTNMEPIKVDFLTSNNILLKKNFFP